MGKNVWTKIVPVFFFIISGSKIMLEFLGDVDFIIERLHNPGWLGYAYNHFVSFSPKANMAIFIFSILAFGYILIKTNKKDSSFFSAIIKYLDCR